MIRLLAALLSLLLVVDPASAAVVQITVKDAAGTTRNMNVTTNTDITGNLDFNEVICDQAAGTTCASVGTAGSPSTNALTIQAVTLGHGTAANAMRVELPTDGTGVVGLAAGTQVIGHVIVDSGTVTTISTVTNLSQMNGAALLMGNGVTGTGSQRVTIASDNTAFSVNSTLSAETTKVIGTTRTVGNVGGVLDAIGQNVAAPANWLQTGCQFQTSPTTITATNGSPLQCNNAAQLLVSVANANANGQALAANSSPVVAPVLTVAGAAVVKGGVPVVNGGSTYQHVAASQTGAVLQTSTGAAGDYLSHCVIYPSTTAAGSVTVFDNANAAATNVIEFTTGTLSNLAPITLPVGAVSTAGAWKVTTGTNETVICYGKFS